MSDTMTRVRALREVETPGMSVEALSEIHHLRSKLRATEAALKCWILEKEYWQQKAENLEGQRNDERAN